MQFRLVEQRGKARTGGASAALQLITRTSTHTSSLLSLLEPRILHPPGQPKRGHGIADPGKEDPNVSMGGTGRAGAMPVFNLKV